MSGPPELFKLKMRLVAAHSLTRFVSPSLQSQSLLFGFIAHPFRRRLPQMQWIRLRENRAAVQACRGSPID